MAQVSVVRLGPRQLGALSPLQRDEFLALGVLATGLVAATGIWLFASGRRTEAYALGVASAISGAFVGAAKVLG